MSNLTAVIRLGRDAETGQVGSNTVTSFSGAYNTGYGDKKVTTWVNCSYWRKSDGIMPYLKKGASIMVTGEPHLREWSKDGRSGTSLELNVDRITLVGGNDNNAGGGNQQQQPAQQQSQGSNANQDMSDDVPFASLNTMIKNHLI